MQSLSLRYDTLIEIATFLVRRWSEDDKITVELSPRKEILTRLGDKRVILNTLETRRIEMLGRKVWQGMDEEMIFSYTYQWLYRPILSSIYGKARTVEAFYQYFIMGDIKGEIQPSQFEKVVEAVRFAKE